MAATGAADGEYMLGGRRVIVRNRIARLADGGAIAGSTLTLDAAFRNAVTSVGIPVETAVMALTQTPAQAIRRAQDLGRLAVGYAADAVLLDQALNVTDVWIDGLRLDKRLPA